MSLPRAEAVVTSDSQVTSSTDTSEAVVEKPILQPVHLDRLSVRKTRFRTASPITRYCNQLFQTKEVGKDIIKKGMNKVGHKQYFCFHCEKTFVETSNTPLFHKHLSEKEIINIFSSVAGLDRDFVAFYLISIHPEPEVSGVLEIFSK